MPETLGAGDAGTDLARFSEGHDLLAAGLTLDGLSSLASALAGNPDDRGRKGPNPMVVWNELSAASLFAMGAEDLDDYRVAMGWLQRRLSAVPAPRPLYRHIFSSALGGLLLRAGRVDEAIVRLNEAITAAEVEIPTDWAYLALAHTRKGDFAEARRSLERVRAARPDPSASFWELQELALLRSEAESLLFDAEFPGDPF